MFIPILQDYYVVLGVLVGKVNPKVFRENASPWHPSKGHFIHVRKRHPILHWCPGPNSTFSHPPPPSGRWGGFAAPKSMLTLKMGREKSGCKGFRTLENVPSAVDSPYTRFPSPSLVECRLLLTMREGCDMANMTCSPSFSCWYGGPLGQRGLSERRTLREGGRSWGTQRVRH